MRARQTDAIADTARRAARFFDRCSCYGVEAPCCWVWGFGDSIVEKGSRFKIRFEKPVFVGRADCLVKLIGPGARVVTLTSFILEPRAD